MWPHSVLDPQAVSGEPEASRLVWLESHFEGSSFQMGVIFDTVEIFLSFLDLRVIICKSAMFKCGYYIFKKIFWRLLNNENTLQKVFEQ